MPTLIDGYNLLHATGRLTARAGRQALESARRSLLIQVRTGHEPDARDVTVVFDARGAPAGADTQSEFGGIRVLFAKGQTADDLIEDLIRAEASPRLLTVVSDDHRIQRAARRRGCRVTGCLDYVEQLLAPRSAAPQPTASDPTAKPESSTPEEMQQWLDAFGGADDALVQPPDKKKPGGKMNSM
jgi:predicted RNA-binding protein with PIN domain